MTYLAGDPISTFLIGAAIAWVIHSSVAAILLFLALVVQQVLPINAAIALVLGANLGGSLIAFWLTLGAALPARPRCAPAPRPPCQRRRAPSNAAPLPHTGVVVLMPGKPRGRAR